MRKVAEFILKLVLGFLVGLFGLAILSAVGEGIDKYVWPLSDWRRWAVTAIIGAIVYQFYTVTMEGIEKAAVEEYKEELRNKIIARNKV